MENATKKIDKALLNRLKKRMVPRHEELLKKLNYLISILIVLIALDLGVSLILCRLVAD